MDEDQTGLIDEEEFTRFFRNHKFNEISEKLEQQALLSGTTITVTEYGYTGQPTTVQQIEGKDFAQWLKDHGEVPKGRKRWFDMRGYNLHVMQLLGIHYDLHGEIIKDAGCLQPNKVEIVNSKSKASSHIAQVILQTLTLQGSPFTTQDMRNEKLRNASWLSKTFNQVKKGSYKNDELVSAEELHRHPPAMSQRQICLLCIGDNMLISVVKDQSDAHGHGKKMKKDHTSVGSVYITQNL